MSYNKKEYAAPGSPLQQQFLKEDIEIANELPVSDGSGGSGAGLESYQNSAMSAAVQAYVYRDEDDNIVRVYEPLRNNDVSRNIYAYADSIDVFPFDNVDCFNSTLKDVKLLNIDSTIKIQNCTLETMVIKSNKTNSYLITGASGDNTFQIDSTSGDLTSTFIADYIFTVIGGINGGQYTVVSSSFDGTNTSVVVASINSNVAGGRINVATGVKTVGNQLLDVNWKGGFAVACTNEAEIYFTGDNAYMEDVLSFGKRSFIDSIGENSYVYGFTMLNDTNAVYFNNTANSNVGDGLMWEDSSKIRFYFDGTYFFDFIMGGASTVFLGSNGNQQGCQIGDFVNIGSSSKRYLRLFNVKVDNHSNLIPDADNTATIQYIDAGMHLGTVTTSGNINDKHYKNIDGIKYLLGVTDGAVTATAV